MKKRWLQIITLLLCLILFVVAIQQKKAIRELNEYWRYQVAVQAAKD
jgi:hypothetical protein